MSIVNRLDYPTILIVQDIRKSILLQEELYPNQIIRFNFKPQVINISIVNSGNVSIITSSPSDINLIIENSAIYNDQGDQMPSLHVFDEEQYDVVTYSIIIIFIIALLILVAINFKYLKKLISVQ